MEKNRRKKNTNKKKLNKRRRFINFIVILTLLTTVYFTFTLVRNKVEYNRLNNQLDELISERKEIEEEIKNLEKNYEDRDSLEFAEKVAREKLGMIKAKEYIIKEKTDKLKD